MSSRSVIDSSLLLALRQRLYRHYLCGLTIELAHDVTRDIKGLQQKPLTEEIRDAGSYRMRGCAVL